MVQETSIGWAIKYALDNNLVTEAQRAALSFDNAGNMAESNAYFSTALTVKSAVAVRSSKDYARCDGVAPLTAGPAAALASGPRQALPPSTPVPPTVVAPQPASPAKPAVPLVQYKQRRSAQLAAFNAQHAGAAQQASG